MALNKLHSEPFFEGLDLLAQRRLGCIAALGSPSKVTGLCERYQIFKLPKTGQSGHLSSARLQLNFVSLML